MRVRFALVLSVVVTLTSVVSAQAPLPSTAEQLRAAKDKARSSVDATLHRGDFID